MPAQKYRQAFPPGLMQSQIEFRDVRFRQRLCPGICDHADNGDPGCAISDSPEALADGILVWPVRAREGLIDHRNLRGRIRIQIGEQPAAHERDAQQVKIFRSHAGPFDHSRLVAGNVVSLECEQEGAFGDHFQIPLVLV
jgi:hypothetical protein